MTPPNITINAGSHTFRVTASPGLILHNEPMLRLAHPNGSLTFTLPAALFPWAEVGDEIILTVAAFRARLAAPPSAILPSPDLPDTLQ